MQILEMTVISTLEFKDYVIRLGEFIDPKDEYKLHHLCMRGRQLWSVKFDGTVDGFTQSLINVQDNCPQMLSIADYIGNLFSGPVDRERILQFVRKTSYWSNFNVIYQKLID